MSPQQTRARPLSRVDRRAAIIAAVTPLLIERGAATTSADMATAAAVAEGTIFKVFADKGEIIREALRVTLDPSQPVAALDEIDPGLPLEDQLRQAARIMSDRFNKVTALMEIFHSLPRSSHGSHPEGRSFVQLSVAEVSNAILRLFERASESIAVPPQVAATALRGMLFANAHHLHGPEDVSVDQLIRVILTGIAVTEES